MKYCIDYIFGGDYMDEVDELMIETTENHNYGSFISKRPNQRVIIKLMDKNHLTEKGLLKVFLALKQEMNLTNFAILLPRECENLDDIKPFKDAGIDYFFIDMANTWLKLRTQAEFGVSDIYITEALGFDMIEVGKFCHSRNIKTRTFPNIAQQELPIYDLHSFFIRPEDIATYDDSLDVCEFYFKEKLTEQSVYYKIYAKDKKWFGELQEIIIGLKQPIDSRYIIKQFAEARIDCRLRCLRTGACRICDRCLELGGTLKKAGLIIDNSKKI